MKRLKIEDLKIAKQLSDFIEKLDKIIFSNKAIEVFVLAQPPPNESERFRYCSQTPSFITDITDYEGELYLIFGGGLVERIEKEKQKTIMLFKNSELAKTIDQSPKFSLEEILIAIAVHEIRHRLQYHYPNRIFSPQDYQHTNNEYLKIIFRYVETLCREIYSSSKEFKKEFDAAIIEHIIVDGWHHKKRNFSDIARIIKSDF